MIAVNHASYLNLEKKTHNISDMVQDRDVATLQTTGKK